MLRELSAPRSKVPNSPDSEDARRSGTGAPETAAIEIGAPETGVFEKKPLESRTKDPFKPAFNDSGGTGIKD
jgi:hypothetical protein